MSELAWDTGDIIISNEPPVEPTNQVPALYPFIWYSADVGVYKTGTTPAADGDSVERWLDRSGNGHDATQVSAPQDPVFKTNQVNGYPVLRFSRAAQSRLWTNNIITNQPIHSFIVAKFSDSGAVSPLFSDHDTTYSTLLERTATNSILFDDDVTTGSAIYTNSPVAGSFFCIEAIYYVTGAMTINHEAELTAPFAVRPLYEFTVGARKWDTSSLEGDIAEILLFAGDGSGHPLSTTNRTAIKNYLFLKYGL